MALNPIAFVLKICHVINTKMFKASSMFLFIDEGLFRIYCKPTNVY